MLFKLAKSSQNAWGACCPDSPSEAGQTLGLSEAHISPSAHPGMSESHLTPYKKPQNGDRSDLARRMLSSLFNQQLLVNLATSVEWNHVETPMNQPECLTFPSAVGKSATFPSTPASSPCKIIPSCSLKSLFHVATQNSHHPLLWLLTEATKSCNEDFSFLTLALCFPFLSFTPGLH